MNRKPLAFLTLLFLTAAGFLSAQATNDIIAKADSAVYTVSWSPDGRYFATSGNNFVILWYADTNTTKSFYAEHGVPIVSSEFSRDSKWFLSVGSDNSVIVRSLDNVAPPAKIQGKSSTSIKDAVFLDNGFSVVAPVNGRKLTTFFRLMATQEFVQKKLFEARSEVYSLDVNHNGSRLLVATEDGNVQIVEAVSGELLQDVPRYSLSRVKPRFSPDGKEWIAASDKANLTISYTDRIGARVIRDADQFVNAAVFSPDGKKVAAALKNGVVKIYDSADGTIQKQFFLVDAKDVAVSLEYSPDGEFLLAGTKLGFIYRWSLTGKVFDEEKHKYVDKKESSDSEPEQKTDDNSNAQLQELIDALKQGIPVQPSSPAPAPAPAPQAPASGSGASGQQSNAASQPMTKKSSADFKTGHGLIVEGGVCVPPDPYSVEATLDVGYLNFDLIRPFYVGAVVKGYIAFALGEFPYSYTLNKDELACPKLTGLKAYMPLGFVFYPFNDFVEVFAELDAGLSLNWLWDGRLGSEALFSDAFSSFYGAVKVGGGWRFLRFSVSGEYDKVLGFSFSGELGVNVQLGGKQKD